MSFLSGSRSLCITHARRWAQASTSQLAHQLTGAIADGLDNPDGGGANSLSVYESSWVALVRDPARPSQLAYPETFIWILQQQRADGGWGPPGPYSVLPTMAALLAALSYPEGIERRQRVVAAGAHYLRETLARHDIAALDTPFVELLAPLVAERVRERRLELSFAELEPLRARGVERRARLPEEALYHPRSPLIHALEAFGPIVNYQRLRARRTRNGGYGASPAATASALLHAPEWDHSAANWLARLGRFGGAHRNGGMPVAHPLDVFEAAWTLHFLLQGGFQLSLRDSRVAQIASWLRESLTANGVGPARNRALPEDGDDTATTLATLNDLGVQTPLDPLRDFEANSHYLSYHGESSASLSANAHALEALLSVASGASESTHGRIQTTLAYLLERRRSDGYWSDKWHISPYYATLACVHALARTSDPAAHQSLIATLEWITQTQLTDGGWGHTGSSVEETAYALLTATAARRVVAPLAQGDRSVTAAWPSMVARGRRYLQRHMIDLAHPDRLPPMWVDKDLYAPPRIIRAAVLAALHSSLLARQGSAF
jgi:halimadienyl-diphosphate synthase